MHSCVERGRPTIACLLTDADCSFFLVMDLVSVLSVGDSKNYLQNAYLEYRDETKDSAAALTAVIERGLLAAADALEAPANAGRFLEESLAAAHAVYYNPTVCAHLWSYVGGDDASTPPVPGAIFGTSLVLRVLFM